MDKLERLKVPAVVEDEKMEIIYDALKNGGGGGGGNTFDLGLHFDTDIEIIFTTLTVKEIMDQYEAGKSATGSFKFMMGDHPFYVQVTPGYIGYSTEDEMYLMTASFQGLESMGTIFFEGFGLNETMHASFGG